MRCAIYARKSTDQSGVADDQKSVTRQVEHARAYATRKGWTVLDDHIYADDGISGADFDRPDFLRLMNSLKPKRRFDVLIMSEESRLGRESIQTAYALRQITLAGVRVFFYLDDRERTLDTPTDKVLMSLTAFADELERERGRQRTADAMHRIARRGHVTGGRVFGYDNQRVEGQGVVRTINATEAEVVRRIYDEYADGAGLVRIAKGLNAERIASPRPQQGRPAGWCASSVREVLHRELYHGVIVYNRTRKRDKWGQKRRADRPPDEWVRVEAPDLKIVTDEQWESVQTRLTKSRAQYLAATKGVPYGRPRDQESNYLLTSFMKCSTCGSTLVVRSRSHGRQRFFFYGCQAHHNKGAAVCINDMRLPMGETDQAVLGMLLADVLTEDVIGAVVERVIEELAPERRHAEVARLRAEQRNVETELTRLSEAIATTGALPSLVEAVRERDAERQRLVQAVDAAEAACPRIDLDRVRGSVRTRLTDWRAQLAGDAPEARAILRRLLSDHLLATPVRQGVRLAGKASYGKLLRGVIETSNKVASPTEDEQTYDVPIIGDTRHAA